MTRAAFRPAAAWLWATSRTGLFYLCPIWNGKNGSKYRLSLYNRLTQCTRLLQKALATLADKSPSKNPKVTNAPNANVRVDIPRVVVAIHGAVAVVNAVVPIPAANERVKRAG